LFCLATLLDLGTVALQPKHFIVFPFQLGVQSCCQVELSDCPFLDSGCFFLEPAGKLLDSEVVVAADEGDFGLNLANERRQFHLQLAQHLLLFLLEQSHQIAAFNGLVVALSRLLPVLAVLKAVRAFELLAVEAVVCQSLSAMERLGAFRRTIIG
jgi:hypothetical protein